HRLDLCPLNLGMVLDEDGRVAVQSCHRLTQAVQQRLGHQLRGPNGVEVLLAARGDVLLDVGGEPQHVSMGPLRAAAVTHRVATSWIRSIPGAPSEVTSAAMAGSSSSYCERPILN